jgi:glycosyltransferase involved in cell wall biosynthesis
MLQPGALSLKANKKSLFLYFAKVIRLFETVRWHATSESEVKAIKKYAGENADVFLAPNLSAAKVIEKSPLPKSAGELKLISIARISPEKGILEAIQYLAAAQLHGQINVSFYGTQQNYSYLEKCKSLAATIPGIEISFPGEVDPSLIPSLMASAHFFYSATWGENHGHAIVESLQCGVPVIISNRTPWKNLAHIGAGWDLSTDESVFAKVLQQALSMDQEEYTQMCRKAASLGETISLGEVAVKLNMDLFE